MFDFDIKIDNKNGCEKHKMKLLTIISHNEYTHKICLGCLNDDYKNLDIDKNTKLIKKENIMFGHIYNE